MYEKLIGRPCPSQYSQPDQYIQWWADAEAHVKAIKAIALAERLNYLFEK